MNLDISQTSHPTVNPQGAHPVRTSPPAPPKVRPTTSSAWHRVWPWVRLLSGPLAAVLAILVLRSGAIPLYTEFTIGLGAVYALMVLSLSLLASWTGIWSIGHPALVAIGAYAMAYGSGHGWSLQLTIALTVTACALIGAFLGFVGLAVLGAVRRSADAGLHAGLPGDHQRLAGRDERRPRGPGQHRVDAAR